MNLKKNKEETERDLILQDDFLLNPYYQPGNQTLEELQEELWEKGYLLKKV